MGQLKMYRPDAPVPAYSIPENYRFRTLSAGEEHLWCRACLDAFVKSEDIEEYRLRMSRGVEIQNVFVAEYIGNEDLPDIAGTATAQLLDDGAYLHYVAVRDAHQGKRLAFSLCAAVLERHRALNHRGCFLTTDDFRLPAIKTYLNLGFLPVLWSEDARERWDSVLKELKADGVRYLSVEECGE